MSVLCALVLISSLMGQAPDVPSFVKEYAQQTTFYYKSPDPSLGSKMMESMLQTENVDHPWFQQKPHVLQLLAAMMGDIAIGKPETIRNYEAAFAGATLSGRRVIVRSLMNCGDKETLKQVEVWLGDKQLAESHADLKPLKTHLADPQRKHARDRAAREPGDLDFLWVNFFVTGEYEPVSRILDVFDLPDAKENEVLKGAARWSLGSNLQQHPKLAELVQKNKAKRPEASRKVIGELIIIPEADKK